MCIGDKKPLVKRLIHNQEVLAFLKENTLNTMYSKEKEIPVPMQKQSAARALCKKMPGFNDLQARERMAVLKSFAEDVSGGIADIFLEMDEEERSEYIGSIVTDL
jgi:hypothetical protein